MSTKAQMLLGDLHRKEHTMVSQLGQLAERHPGHQEVYHVAQDIARWSSQHLERLEAAAQEYGMDLNTEEGPDDGARLEDKRYLGGGSDAIPPAEGDQPLPEGLQLLEDLRAIYLHAADLSIDWELLGQEAQALKDAELLALSAQCHPGTLRQMRWANAMLKASAPQVMAS
ncbi:MAG TPA: hypothetical protein VK063_03610 [Beutenbergiaceae bacterium]|nr:hypothetical protein [Beutenbergiaceae bacterium]